jgi:hypothetical protein
MNCILQATAGLPAKTNENYFKEESVDGPYYFIA